MQSTPIKAQIALLHDYFLYTLLGTKGGGSSY